MTTKTITITGDGSEVKILTYMKHHNDLNGLIEVGGSFGGGTLSLLISLSSGAVINPWCDLSGLPYTLVVPKTVSFHLPCNNPNVSDIRIYYSLLGSTTPSIILTIADNT